MYDEEGSTDQAQRNRQTVQPLPSSPSRRQRRDSAAQQPSRRRHTPAAPARPQQQGTPRSSHAPPNQPTWQRRVTPHTSGRGNAVAGLPIPLVTPLALCSCCYTRRPAGSGPTITGRRPSACGARPRCRSAARCACMAAVPARAWWMRFGCTYADALRPATPAAHLATALRTSQESNSFWSSAVNVLVATTLLMVLVVTLMPLVRKSSTSACGAALSGSQTEEKSVGCQ